MVSFTRQNPRHQGSGGLRQIHVWRNPPHTAEFLLQVSPPQTVLLSDISTIRGLLRQLLSPTTVLIWDCLRHAWLNAAGCDGGAARGELAQPRRGVSYIQCNYS